MKLKIRHYFKHIPDKRYRREGPFSAEEFRDDILLPKLASVINTQDILEIDFDGSYGYSSGWLEVVFGGIIRKTKIINIPEFIHMKSGEFIKEIYQSFIFMFDAIITICNSSDDMIDKIHIANIGTDPEMKYPIPTSLSGFLDTYDFRRECIYKLKEYYQYQQNKYLEMVHNLRDFMDTTDNTTFVLLKTR